MGRRYAVASFLLISIVLCTTSISAETTVDLYKVYGVEDDTSYTQLRKHLSNLKNSYDYAVKEYNYVKEFNAVIDSLGINKLKYKKKEKKKELKELEKEIQQEGFFKTYDELQQMYSCYNECKSEYESIEKRYAKYKGKKKLPVPDYNLNDMLYELNTVEDEFAKVKLEATLGDVTNVTNFLENTYCVKREFDGTQTMMRAVQDTGVLALFDGHITFSDRHEDFGETIVLDCGDGVEVTYYGVRARYVQVDDTVRQYQKIATTNDGIYVSLKIKDKFYDINNLYKDRLTTYIIE